MAIQELTLERAREAFRYDPASGMLYRRHGDRERVGTARAQGYLVVTFGGKQYKAHCLAWLQMTGSWPVGPIEHVNRIKTDNRWVNLRYRGSEPVEEERAAVPSTEIIGVIPEGDGWVAVIPHEGELLGIGPFETHAAAHDAFATAASTALWRETSSRP